MFSFKKNRIFSLNAMFGFDFRKIDFESIFPFDTNATTSLAVETVSEKPSNLMLLHDFQGTVDPVFNSLLNSKQAELQRAIYEQSPTVCVEAAWLQQPASADNFAYLNTNTQMSEVLDFIFQSHLRQRRPVLVNFERSVLLNTKPGRLSALVKRDAFFHIHFLSLTGYHGQSVQRTAYQLLHSKRVAYMGFEMNDFSILENERYISLSEPVISLLAAQDIK